MTSIDVDVLLEAVRRSDRLRRIKLRDQVAAYGAAAVEPMAGWLDDRERAAFAVRVLERIGQQDGQLRPVVRALSAGHAAAATPAIASDIEQAVDRLAQLTVTANDVTRLLGASTPAFTVSYSGFVNGETPTVLGGTLVVAPTGSVSSTVPGIYTLRATGQTLRTTRSDTSTAG